MFKFINKASFSCIQEVLSNVSRVYEERRAKAEK